MRRVLLGLAVVLALASCREGAGGREAPLPDPLAEATRACERSGGRMVKSGIANAQVCLSETRDSGKMCRASSDCEGECLARSGTCAPANPMFGCHEVLMDNGARATLCRD